MKRSIEALSPAYFGMAMATGIVSLAAHLAAMAWIARLLFALNLAVYAGLWVVNLLRAARHGAAFRADLADHLRAPGYFTWVAATGVLGAQCVILQSAYRAAWLLWAVALVLWIVFTYGIFAALTVKAEKPALDRGINGAWLLAVVATQSIAVLSTLLAMREGAPWKVPLNFLALSMWLWGGMLYIWMMTLIFYRYTFFRLAPGDLTPPYWINMGAMAISTLAGSLLIASSRDAPLLAALRPFLEGFTVFYWATGTWWIPMLLLLGAWRYLYMRHPLRYDPLYWGAVFPLGMYAAATHEMSLVLDLGFLRPLSDAFAYIALAAWALVSVGFLASLASRRAEG